MDNVELLDTTLREGEQTPNVSFTAEQKLEIARKLDEFGIDFIEAGHPVVSSDIHKAVKAICNEGLNANILAHSRCVRSDIDQIAECGADWIGLFFCVANQSLEERFRVDKEKAQQIVVDSIEHAKSQGLKVRYTPEDTVRTDIRTVTEIAKAAVEAGADRISVADTTGAMTPSMMYRFVSMLKLALPDNKINVHCHNDLGLAVANSLSAVEAGASLVDVTVNGLGERTGITSLAEVTTALRFLYNVKNEWKLTMLPELSEIVEKYSGIAKADQAPITGKYAFTHNAGLHVSAMIKNPSHYENIRAELVGREREFALTKFSGKHTVEHHRKNGTITEDTETVLNSLKGNNDNSS
jgi:2-isopropylmalate synthase